MYVHIHIHKWHLVNGRATVAEPNWYTKIAVVSVYLQLDSQT